MTLGEFSTPFKRLLDAHGKSFHEGISDTYYDQFKNLNLKQWEDTVQVLINTCETFPKIPAIRRIITEKNWWNSSNAQSGMYIFTCKCSEKISTEIVTNAGRLTRAIEENMSFHCPNQNYTANVNGKEVKLCNKTYSALYFRNNSTYIPKAY